MKTNVYLHEEIFKNFIIQLVEMTFGFTPEVILSMPDTGKVALVLDGTEIQKSIMMGKDAANFKAMKYLLRSFGHRHGYFTYLFLAPYNFENQYEKIINY